jgi:predicted signal transduction protein with EAL and GGDEF domain
LSGPKRAARGSVRFFTADMSSAADERWGLESDLRHALDRGELEVHYQPKVDISTNRVRSAEALLHWRHPRRGLVPPILSLRSRNRTG